MITTHDVIRGMALRLSDEVSHIPPEELQKDAKQEYLNAEKGIRLGMRFMAEQIFQPEKEEGRPV